MCEVKARVTSNFFLNSCFTVINIVQLFLTSCIVPKPFAAAAAAAAAAIASL